MIDRVYHLDRGYECIEEKLSNSVRASAARAELASKDQRHRRSRRPYLFFVSCAVQDRSAFGSQMSWPAYGRIDSLTWLHAREPHHHRPVEGAHFHRDPAAAGVGRHPSGRRSRDLAPADHHHRSRGREHHHRACLRCTDLRALRCGRSGHRRQGRAARAGRGQGCTSRSTSRSPSAG